ALFYLLTGVAFVWLGVGSILMRRWARALILVLSSWWLVCGVLALAIMPMVLTSVLKGAATESSPGENVPIRFVMVFVLALLGAFFVVLPGVLLLFFGSKNVKMTVEARDPVL